MPQQISEDAVGERSVPSEDALFDVLANSRRRHLIELLAAEGESYDIGTLSTRIAARENDIDIQAVTSDERKRVYTALQQSHLPKLDSAGFIDFDKRRGTVQPQSALTTAEEYLTTARSGSTWSYYYLGLAAISTVVIMAVWSGLWPFTLVQPLVWTICIVGLLGCMAAVHRYEPSSMSVW